VSARAAYRGRRVLVTGGLGFLGSHVARALLEHGARVVVLDALVPGLGGDPAHLVPSAELDVILADLRDEDALARALDGAERIFHLAGSTGHLRSMAAPRDDLSLNADATCALIEAWRTRAPTARLVFASTRQIYGLARGPLDEMHPIDPVDVHGVSKSACEQLLRVAARAHGLEAVSLRLTNAYGPRMPLSTGRGDVLGAFLRRALAGDDLEVYSPGTDRRSFVHAEDVAAAFLTAGIIDACVGRALNVGGSPPCSIEELARIVAKVGGVRAREIPFPSERRAIDVGDHPLDDRAFRALTSLRPRWEDLEAGLRHTFEALSRVQAR
jgi:UDP-glucose 4-epimerase